MNLTEKLRAGTLERREVIGKILDFADDHEAEFGAAIADLYFWKSTKKMIAFVDAAIQENENDDQI